jgi:hypothetical protein
MAVLVPAIHVGPHLGVDQEGMSSRTLPCFLAPHDVDGQDKPGHDEMEESRR